MTPFPRSRGRAASRLALAPFVTLALVSGCNPHNDIGGPCVNRTDALGNVIDFGGDACGSQFYFPSGVTVDPAQPNLVYVSNANADLRYSGGTVNSVDTAFFECAMAYACMGTNLGKATCTAPYTMAAVAGLPECAPYASALAKLRDDRQDQGGPQATGSRGGCHPDKTDPSTLDCDEELFLPSAVRIGNFAGAMRVQTAPYRRLWLPVRGDPSITFIDLATTPSGATALSCVDDSAHSPDVPDSCGSQRITIEDFQENEAGAPGAACASDSTTCVTIPVEPFGVALDQGCSSGAVADATTGGCAAGDPPYARLLVAHLQGGEVTLVDATVANPTSMAGAPSATPVVRSVLQNLFPADSAGRRGTFSIATQQPGNPHAWWYATSRTNALVATFRIFDAEVLGAGPSIPLGGGPYSTGSDERDLVFDPCTANDPGCRAFALDEAPPSLFTIDTRIDPAGGATPGLPRNQIVDIVPTCQGPAHLGFRRTVFDGQVRDRLYVVCFDSSQVLVIDPDLATVIASIQAGGGAEDIAFNFGYDVVRGRDLPEPTHRRAFVTDFLESTLAVIDLDPGSPTENHVIGRIGIPDPARSQ